MIKLFSIIVKKLFTGLEISFERDVWNLEPSLLFIGGGGVNIGYWFIRRGCGIGFGGIYIQIEKIIYISLLDKIINPTITAPIKT